MRLTGLQWKENNPGRRALNNGNGPLSIWRESTPPSLAESEGQVTIYVSQNYRIVRTGDFAGVFEQHPLPVGRNIFCNIPIMPGKVDFIGASQSGRIHAQPGGVQC